MKKEAIKYLLLFITLVGLCEKTHSQRKAIKVRYERNADKSISFYYDKKAPGSYFLTLKFNISENTDASTFKKVIKNKSGFLLKIKPIDKNRAINFSYRTSWIRGVPNPKIDSLFPYVFPFKKGTKIQIKEQGNVGEKYFDNEKPKNWKSYAIRNKTTDTVRSMRKGLVVEITNKYEQDTVSSFTTKQNIISIEHPDGTIATYKGFKKNSVFIKLDQTVYPQTPLGLLNGPRKKFYTMSFYVQYLIDVKLKNKKTTLLNRKSRRAFLTPYFYIEGVSTKLIDREKYIVDFNKSLFLKEFTRKELRKYKKKHKLFK